STEPLITLIGPNLLQLKHAQTIKLPPPCFTVGARQSWLNLSDLILLTRLARDPCQSWILHSSDQTVCFHCFLVQFRRLRHQITRLLAFNFEINGLLTAILDL